MIIDLDFIRKLQLRRTKKINIHKLLDFFDDSIYYKDLENKIMDFGISSRTFRKYIKELKLEGLVYLKRSLVVGKKKHFIIYKKVA